MKQHTENKRNFASGDRMRPNLALIFSRGNPDEAHLMTSSQDWITAAFLWTNRRNGFIAVPDKEPWSLLSCFSCEIYSNLPHDDLNPPAHTPANRQVDPAVWTLHRCVHETACSSAKTSTFGINIVSGFVALCISAGSGYIRQPRWAAAKYIWPCAVTMVSRSTRYIWSADPRGRQHGFQPRRKVFVLSQETREEGTGDRPMMMKARVRLPFRLSANQSTEAPTLVLQGQLN